ncbi:MAG: hypothetical protein ACLVI4_10690 [Anaerovoracaceae bacterium]
MNQSTLPTGGRKFVMSYSCGKDSTLALHKMVAAGNVPVALIVMVNKNMDRSFFTGPTVPCSIDIRRPSIFP